MRSLATGVCASSAFVVLVFIAVLAKESLGQKCERVFVDDAASLVSIDYPKLDHDKERYQFSKFAVTLPDKVAQLFECKVKVFSFKLVYAYVHTVEKVGTFRVASLECFSVTKPWMSRAGTSTK